MIWKPRPHSRKWCVISATVLFIFLLSFSTWAQSSADNKNTKDPEVEVKVPRSYYVKKIAFFPLYLPGYVIHGVLWPLDKGLSYLEKKHVVERVSDALSNEDKTLWGYPIIAWGAGSSFGFGMGIRDIDLFHKGYQFDANYLIRINLDQRARVSFTDPRAFYLWDRPFHYTANLNFDHYRDQDFYGIGNGSNRSNHGTFTENDIEGNFILTYEPFNRFFVKAFAGMIADNSGPPSRGSRPSVNTLFPASQTSGYNRWIPYFRVGMGVEHDTRDNQSSPWYGGLQTLTFERFQSLGGNYDYNQYSLDVRHYIPLWRQGMTLMLRNTWIFQQETGGSAIPFYRLAILDANHMLRGFKRGRFHDTASVVFNFEYHYPISNMLEGIVLCDTGRVFHGPADFSFKNFKYSVGGGLNVKIFAVSLLRFKAAYGGEGVNFMLGIGKEI